MRVLVTARDGVHLHQVTADLPGRPGVVGQGGDDADRRGRLMVIVGFVVMTFALFVLTVMPPIGLLLGNVDFSNIFTVIKEGEAAAPYATLADAQAAGAVTVNWGLFILTIISFLIIALAIFLLIRQLNRMQREEEAPPEEPTTKECPYCLNAIPIKATRCGFCTSQLGGASAS